MADERRKRARYRAWHRGTREMDLILGSFADRWIDAMDADEFQAFEALLGEPDPALFAWIVQGDRPGPSADLALIERLRGHRPLGGAAKDER